MARTKTFAASLAAIVVYQAASSAQTAPAFDKNNDSHSEWAKGAAHLTAP
jgi:hypothetical protein